MSGGVFHALTIGIVTEELFKATTAVEFGQLWCFVDHIHLDRSRMGLRACRYCTREIELPKKNLVTLELNGSINKKIECDPDVYEGLIVSGSAEWVRMAFNHTDYGVTLLHGFCRNEGGRGTHS
jgi:hypothetical protein